MKIWKTNRELFVFLLVVLLGFFLWFLPKPDDVSIQGWHLFAIFFATIIGVILKPFPMGVIAIFALTVTVVTGTLSFADAFSGFSNEIVWLVVFAFFISRGVILSGLGNRIAYKIMSLIGKNSLGLGYGLVATDFILAPMIPSLTARAGGVVYPLLKALTAVFTGNSHDPKMGAFLTLAAFQGTAITSAMFLTAMAGNPLIADFVRNHGVEITWMNWMLAAIVPGLVSLAIVPYVIYRFISPVIRSTPHAKQMAQEKLAAMGPFKREEKIVLATFIFLIILWMFGEFIGIRATVTAMIGLQILLLTKVLRWKDLLEEHGAWDTFLWFAVLVTIPTFLSKLGFTSWFSHQIVSDVSSFSWIPGFFFVSLIYFYSHYFFASNVGHISAMFAPFFLVSIALGTPPYLAALFLGFLSSLFGGLTHYGSGPAPIFFGAGFVSITQWWQIGAITSLVNLSIWMIIGALWWKVLGLW
jgi:DASS family divalent anion:Na+ symporter